MIKYTEDLKIKDLSLLLLIWCHMVLVPFNDRFDKILKNEKMLLWIIIAELFS